MWEMLAACHAVARRAKAGSWPARNWRRVSRRQARSRHTIKSGPWPRLKWSGVPHFHESIRGGGGHIGYGNPWAMVDSILSEHSVSVLGECEKGDRCGWR